MMTNTFLRTKYLAYLLDEQINANLASTPQTQAFFISFWFYFSFLKSNKSLKLREAKWQSLSEKYRIWSAQYIIWYYIEVNYILHPENEGAASISSHSCVCSEYITCITSWYFHWTSRRQICKGDKTVSPLFLLLLLLNDEDSTFWK